MLQTRINKHTVTIFVSYDSKQLFIDDAKGREVYSARMAKRDSALKRAKRIISQQ